MPDPRQSLVDLLAAKLGLVCIGWIFTDLVTEDASKGTVRHFRNADTHFLSAQECIMAGHFQSLHPNPCRLSSDGYFGSKFVTICVTGNIDKFPNRLNKECVDTEYSSIRRGLAKSGAHGRIPGFQSVPGLSS